MFAHIHVDISVGFGTKQECKRNKPRDEKGMATFRRLTVSLVEAARISVWKPNLGKIGTYWKYLNQTCRPSIEQANGLPPMMILNHPKSRVLCCKPVAMLLYIMLLKISLSNYNHDVYHFYYYHYYLIISYDFRYYILDIIGYYY